MILLKALSVPLGLSFELSLRFLISLPRRGLASPLPLGERLVPDCGEVGPSVIVELVPLVVELAGELEVLVVGEADESFSLVFFLVDGDSSRLHPEQKQPGRADPVDQLGVLEAKVVVDDFGELLVAKKASENFL